MPMAGSGALPRIRALGGQQAAINAVPGSQTPAAR